MTLRHFSKTLIHRARSLALVGCLLLGAGTVLADSPGDSSPKSADRPTMTRSINVDEATVNSALYLTGSIDNDFSLGHSAEFEVEGIFRLDRDWGLDVTFPQILLRQPLGQGAAALGPIGAGFRYVFGRIKTDDGQAAGIFSVEAQASYWATPDSRFPGEGSGFTLQALGGFRLGRFYLQGNYGYDGGFDPDVTPEWFANSSLGYALGPNWALQVEGDFSQASGENGQWVMVPQLGFKTGGWLFEVGEAFTVAQPGTATDLIIERNFF